MKKAIFLFVIFLIAFTTCKKDDPQEKTPTVFEKEGIITAKGGTVQITDTKSPLQNAFVEVPAGALTSDAKISINPAKGKELSLGDSKTILVNMEPSGTKFSSPVRIGIPYSNTVNVDSLKVYYFNDADSVWVNLPVVSIDKTKKILITETTHFSIYIAVDSKPNIWAQLFYANNKISANIKMVTPLNDISTNTYVAYTHQQYTIAGLLNEINYKYFNVIIVADLKENTGFLTLHPVLEEKKIHWRFTDWSGGRPRLVAFEEPGNTLFEQYVELSQIESLISGQMFLFNFNKVTPDASKKYYLDVFFYYMNISEKMFLYTIGGFYKKTDPITISEMRKPFDADGDGIVDAFDKQNGNPPKIPTNVSPVNNATGLALTTSLSWDCSDPDNDPLTYDVYFGTDNPPATKVSPGQTSKTYALSALTAGKDYFWKIVAKDNKGNTTEGPVWKFTTQAPLGTAPVADFTASKTSITKGETIQFTDKSTNTPTSWLWTFGDNTTSTAQNPTKSYSAAGTYTVSLKATNSFGNNTKTNTNYITVSEIGTGGTGTFTDHRDGKTYKTVKIGNQEWMAENMAYLPSVSPPSVSSTTVPYYYVYGYSGTDVAAAKANANYATYGVLYNWSAAKAACPPGWLLPSDAEWKLLEMALGMNQTQVDATNWRGTNQGTQMKTATGWNSNGNGINTSGFSALPAGYRRDYGVFDNIGNYGVWWSSTEGSTSTAWNRSINDLSSSISRNDMGKQAGYSVRCLRDTETSSSKEPPAADFTASSISITKGQSIQFTDKSTNSPTSWLWTFGDGTTSAAQNPTKTYSTVGTYTVSLKATNSFGNNTKTMNITVTELGTLVYQGRTYKTVIINGKEWMAENLAYLPAVSPSSDGSYTAPYYYVYGYSGTDVAAAKANANYATYGVLYNWPAAKAACPPGWHVPSETEWIALTTFLGDRSIAGGKLKEAGTTHWDSPNSGATNETVFSALPAGNRSPGGSFRSIGLYGSWWSSTAEDGTDGAWRFYMSYNDSFVSWSSISKEAGFSVRFVRD